MRDNPDHDTLGNLVGKEAGAGDPQTPPQDEVAIPPEPVDISKLDDKLSGDVEGEEGDDDEDDELNDDNYEGVEQASDVNATEQGQRQLPTRPRRVVVPTWKAELNQKYQLKDLSESPPIINLIILNLTNAIEQLLAPQSYAEILRRRDKNL